MIPRQVDTYTTSSLPHITVAKFLFFALVWLIGYQTTNCAAMVWPVDNAWTAEEEARYSTWIKRIGSRGWRSVDDMLKNREYNSLFTEEDLKLSFSADCGDLPVILRAYYAYRRRLPFIYNYVAGSAGDVRYTRKIRTTRTIDNISFTGTLRSFFAQASFAHSGNFRTEPDRTDSLTYPVAINRQAIRPGTVFYDPTGHAAIVCEVLPSGVIYLIDGHPDQSITRIRFGPKLSHQHPDRVGGFKFFRTVKYEDGKVFWESDNAKLPHFSTEQYGFRNYHIQIQTRLRGSATINPLKEIEDYIIQDTYQELKDRLASVELGWEIGRKQAIAITPNIYASDGDWENYSTPSRDQRLRISYLGIADKVREILIAYQIDPKSVETNAQNVQQLGQLLKHRVADLMNQYTISYTNSQGNPVPLSMRDIGERLFRLSFDPNHVPELRWGATGAELATAPTSPARYHAGYEEQQYWRNRLTKKDGVMHPNDPDNPRQPPPHEMMHLMDQAIREVAAGKLDLPYRDDPPVRTQPPPPPRDPARGIQQQPPPPRYRAQPVPPPRQRPMVPPPRRGFRR